MRSLVLGQMLDPQKRSYPETTQLHLYRDFAELVLFMSAPTSQEKRDVTEGDLQFAIADGAPHLFILGYQFGSQSWCDAPFEAHRAADAGTVLETAGESLALRVLLVDADTGILEGWRFCELPSDFADAIRASVGAQLASPYEPDTAGALLNHLYQQFPSPQALLEEFASVRCRVQ